MPRFGHHTRLAATLTIFASLLLAPAAAHSGTGPSNEHGELNVLMVDVEGTCEITVEGRHVETGVIEFIQAAEGPGGPTTLLTEPFDGDAEAEGGGFRFEEGPFDFPVEAAPDSVRVVIDVDGENHSIVQHFDYEACRVSPTVHVVDELGTLEVDCDFFVVARHLREDSGNLQVIVEGSDDQPHTELYEAEAEDDGAGFRFTSDAIHLAPGTYRVRLIEDDSGLSVVGDPFVVTCAEEPPACPGGVSAEALAEGGIRLTWNASEGADGYRISRAIEFEEEILLGTTNETTFVDDTAAPGVTYQYRVRAFSEGGESRECPVVEATAVPFFGAPILMALALAGSVGAFVWMRRR